MKILNIRQINLTLMPGEYIYNFYLPKHLYALLSPADVSAIYHKLDKTSQDDITIRYQEVKAEKILSRKVIREALDACQAYDRRCSIRNISPLEQETANALNARLVALQKEISRKCMALEKTLERRTRLGDNFLTDHELEVTVDFYLQDEDPWFDDSMDIEEPGRMVSIDLHRFDLNGRYDLGSIEGENKITGPPGENGLYAYCYLFRALVEGGVPLADIHRIGRIWTDIKITLQNAVSVSSK